MHPSLASFPHRHLLGIDGLSAPEIEFLLEDADARALAFEDVASEAVAQCNRVATLRTLTVGSAAKADARFEAMLETAAAEATPRVAADAWSLMLYTSGTTAKPKGVPRRHSAERIAALAKRGEV